MLTKFAVPGDTVQILIDNVKTNIGPGLRLDPSNKNIVTTFSGNLNYKFNKIKNTQLIYVDTKGKRYIPQINDYVIGVIIGTMTDYYNVRLQNFSSPLLLSFLAFSNASKKNRPNLKIGQFVYAKVIKGSSDTDLELDCTDSVDKNSQLGLLDENGFVLNVSLNLARELLFDSKNKYLEILSKKVSFEIAIGMNGKIWIKCEDQKRKEKNQDKFSLNENLCIKSISSMISNEIFHDTMIAVEFLKKCDSINKNELNLFFKKN